jgi:methylglutaconyl-CoA hydratase
MSDSPYVIQKDLSPGIREIEFFHPSHNSLPSEILTQLADTITQAGADDAVRVIILRSGGDRTFCAGASFNELISINDFDTGKKFFLGFANVINACRKCPKPIIGRVQGKAVGGGVGLASAVDHCFATKFASIKLSELAVGIGPFVVGPAVERKVGLSAYSQMTLNATEFYSAQWAKEKGMFAEVFESAEEMDEAIMLLAQKLADSNPEALALLKGVFWQEAQHWDDLLDVRAAMSGKLVLSDFTKKALMRFA